MLAQWQEQGPREVGCLSFDSRYAGLLFEVVTRRYAQKPLLLFTGNDAPSRMDSDVPG